MINEGKILSMLEALHQKNNERFAKLVALQADMQALLEEIHHAVVRINNDHGAQIGALHDGYQLNTELLQEVKAEVAKHDEVILRRIR